MIRPEEVFKTMYPSGEARPHQLVWKVDRNLPYFNGHFPENPILPAIAIVDASTYVLQRALGQPKLALKSVIVAKFLSPIVPDQTVRIEVQQQREQEWQIEWKEDLATNARLLATLRVQL